MSLEPDHGTIGLLIIILLAVISYELDVWETVKKIPKKVLINSSIYRFIIFVCLVQ